MSATNEEFEDIMKKDINFDDGDTSDDFTDPKTPHDRVLVVGGQKFYVYAGHLSYCSESFRTLFYSDFKEKEQQEVELKEVDPVEFHAFLKTLIPGNSDIVNADNYLSVMQCARRFLTRSVMKICGQFALKNFETLDKIELLRFAFEFNVKSLKDKLEPLMTLTSSTGLSTCKKHAECSTFNAICGYCHSTLTKSPYQVTVSPMLENEEELFKLPFEIQAFVLQAMIKNIKK